MAADLALDLAHNCAASYRKAKPEARKMSNGRIEDLTYEERVPSLASHKGSTVDLRRRYFNSRQGLVVQLDSPFSDLGLDTWRR